MEVYGLIGNPIGHSLSPPMHEAAYETTGMDATYVPFEPEPSAVETAVTGADALGMQGLNVTIPFKEAVVDLVEPDALAARIGAVNTIDFSTEAPAGYNTDASGARRALAHHDVAIEGQRALQIGAGGAGRAVAVMLADAGASVAIANRTVDRARTLAADLDGAEAHPLTDIPDLIEGTDLVINTTSVGMEEDRSPIPKTALHDGLTVMDIVYRPLETRLLREAAAAGARTIDGAWMLLFQGVEAFERWTGRDAPVTAMNRALRSRL